MIKIMHGHYNVIYKQQYPPIIESYHPRFFPIELNKSLAIGAFQIPGQLGNILFIKTISGDSAICSWGHGIKVFYS